MALQKDFSITVVTDAHPSSVRKQATVLLLEGVIQPCAAGLLSKHNTSSKRHASAVAGRSVTPFSCSEAAFDFHVHAKLLAVSLLVDGLDGL